MCFAANNRRRRRIVQSAPEGVGKECMHVIALHCSGADGSQWRKLTAALGPGFDVYAPSLIGSGDSGAWHGERAFTLLDEAQPILDIVDRTAARVHLVGHSYGGGVALKVASMRPKRIASLSLYEPSAFHLLRQLGPRFNKELAEIESIAAAVSSGLLTGSYCDAAALFVDYWAGNGAWDALRPEVRHALIRWLPKAPLDFRALLDDGTPLIHYRQLDCPVLVMRGEHALGPSRLIAETIARQSRQGLLEVLPAAGHMGPMTHPTEVVTRFAAHIGACQSRRTELRRRLPPAARSCPPSALRRHDSISTI